MQTTLSSTPVVLYIALHCMYCSIVVYRIVLHCIMVYCIVLYNINYRIHPCEQLEDVTVRFSHGEPRCNHRRNPGTARICRHPPNSSLIQVRVNFQHFTATTFRSCNFTNLYPNCIVFVLYDILDYFERAPLHNFGSTIALFVHVLNKLRLLWCGSYKSALGCQF